MTDRPSLSAAIVEARAKKGMSQIDVVAASQGRVSAGYIAMIEAGHRTPSNDVLDAICDALGLARRDRVELQRLRDAAVPTRTTRSVRTEPAGARPDDGGAVSARKLSAVVEKYRRLSSAQRAAVDRVIDAFLQ